VATPVGLGLSLAVGVLLMFLFRESSLERKRARHDLPVIGALDRLSVREILRGSVVLDESGSGRVVNAGTEGTIETKAHLLPADRERLHWYRKKGWLGTAAPPTLNAGFLLLEGAVGMELSDGGFESCSSPNLMKLACDLPAGLWNGETLGEGRVDLSFNRSYRVTPEMTETPLPVSVVASLVSDAGRRVLDLVIQWDKKYGSLVLDVDRIESLELDVPATWGRLERGTDLAAAGLHDGVTSLEWQGLRVREGDRALRCRTVRVQFQHEIQPSDSLHGRVDVVLRSTLSGIETARLFYPVGMPRPDRPNEIETHVQVDFDLCLTGLRYHQVTRLHVPDEVFSGVVPDHRSVIELTSALSESGFYVQRVVENPPFPGKQTGDTTRSWDIAGRRYRSVYPIDFHIVMSGFESARLDGPPESGTTRVSMSVWGAYSSPAMECEVGQVKSRLAEILRDTLEPLRRNLVDSDREREDGSDDT
jgi:hypothetical protein